MKSTALAVDLGGTKLLLGEVQQDGAILSEKRYPSLLAQGAGQEDVFQQLLSAIEDYLANHCQTQVCGIGIGLVGRVDPMRGDWLEIDPSRCATIPVAQIVRERFHLPCKIDNDVRCALRAEARLGHGRRTRNLLYLNVGTGIGAGILIDGKPVTGASLNAGEVGHHVVAMGGDTVCSCGRRGCVEALASGGGLDRRARLLRGEYPATRLTFPEKERCSAKEIFSLAQKGDALCNRLATDAADALAALIMNLCWVFDPDTIVLGGGVVSDGWLLAQVRQRLLPGPMRFVTNGIFLTELNPNDIALLGAGLSVLESSPASSFE